jgi:glutaredoxin 3
MGTSQSSSAATSENMDATKKFIDDEISQRKVVIFSKSSCPYCVDTKKLFKKNEFKDVDVVIHELNKMKNGSAIQSTLASMSGQGTVPSVWIGGKFIGGNSETQAAYKNGKLSSML